MSHYKACILNVETGKYRVLNYSFRDGFLGPIDLGIHLHLNIYRSFMYDVLDPRNVIVIGKGIFTGTPLIGVHRLVFIFKSPLSRIIHVSTMGGAGYRFMGTGLDSIVIEGRSKEPSIVIIYSDDDCRLRVSINYLALNELNRVFGGFHKLKGVYGLVKYLLENYGDLIAEYKLRPLVIGPASLNTLFGAIYSIDINYKDLSFKRGSEDIAGRGGGGSILYKSHNVIAVLAGGLCKRSYEVDHAKIKDIFRRYFNLTYAEALRRTTEKYRYSSKIGSGGTFGVNYLIYRDLIPTFGYNMVYLSRLTRVRHSNYILEYFCRDFNKYTARDSRMWLNCGEPCPVVCKKIFKDRKVDYEPFNGLGPFIGVFQFTEAIKLVEYVDSMGFDAIELGHVIAWIFDLIRSGLLSHEEVGLDRPPIFDPLTFKPADSIVNMELAMKIIRGLLKNDNPILSMVSENGLRYAAKMLNKLYKDRTVSRGLKYENLAIYAPYGEYGYMTPNYYWTPGVVAPLYMSGRYWTDYHPFFTSPEEYAESALERALYEYNIDNSGICRFHRGWAEKVLEDLYKDVIGIDVNIKKHAAVKYMLIREYALRSKSEPRPWESRKTGDMIVTIASEIGVSEWIEKFNRDYSSSLREWWQRFYKRLDDKLLSLI